MQARRVSEAIQDFRTALIYSRENGDTSAAADIYVLHLAEALAAAGHIDEARSYFLALAEKQPGKAEINLELARLAARQGNTAEASRYYNTAIFGVWDTDPIGKRRAARIEYVAYLLDHEQTAEAQAQLTAMVAALPNATLADAPLHVLAGQLLGKAGANAQALSEFKRALQLDPGSGEAMRGAGMAAFSEGQYDQAEKYLESAGREGELSPKEMQVLETSRQARLLDPFIATLSAQERASRAAYAFSIALKHLQSCADSQGVAAPGTATPSQPLPAHAGDESEQLLADAQKMKQQGTELYLRSHPENVPPLMELVFTMENAPGSRCDLESLDDVALRLVARSHAGISQ